MIYLSRLFLSTLSLVIIMTIFPATVFPQVTPAKTPHVLTPKKQNQQLLGAPKTLATASTYILTGSCLRIGVKSNGTLGVGDTTRPGIQYDPTCLGMFRDDYDWMAPGAFESLMVTFDSVSPMNGTVLTFNNNGTEENNQGWTSPTNLLTNYSGVAYRGTTYDNRVVSVVSDSMLIMENDIRFNDYSTYVEITTYITPTDGHTTAYIARAVRPFTRLIGEDYAMNNSRGYSTIPKKYIVLQESTLAKAVMGYYTGENAANTNTGTRKGKEEASGKRAHSSSRSSWSSTGSWQAPSTGTWIAAAWTAGTWWTADAGAMVKSSKAIVNMP